MRAVAVFASLTASGAAPKKVELAPRTELEHPCSRPVSRTTRKQLEKDVLKPFKKLNITAWPLRCPWDPSKDAYASQERQKSKKRPGGSGTTWTCGICSKQFSGEHYLDLHMERRHLNQTPAEAVCIADYCHIFDTCDGEQKPRRRDKEKECDDALMAKQRRRCEDALFKCFPLDMDAPRKLHAQLSREYCQSLDCAIREEKKKEEDGAHMPVVVVLILVMLICFIVFSIMICCVDYSDEIVQFLLDSQLASLGCVKSLVKAQETTRKVVGKDRTKNI